MAISNNDTIKKLTSLIHLDIDAIHAYEQAIEKIDVQHIKDQLMRFRGDHQRHVSDLSQIVSRMGGQPPQFQKDFKGFLIQGFTALRSVTGTEGALQAMQHNEKLTNSSYDDALKWDLPADVMSVIERNREDERRHLEFINQAISNRAWERKVA